MKLRNQKGNLSIDFLFSLTLILGLTAVIFAVSFALSMVEVTQYISFAVARNYYSGHVNEEAQKNLASAKYRQLSQVKAFHFLFKKNSGWFVLTDPEEIASGIGDFRSEYEEHSIGANDHSTFIGSRINFEAKILSFNVPYFGSSNTESKKNSANVQSFLGREPTSEECMQFQEQRFEQILNIYSNAGVNPQERELYADNGC